MRITNQLIIPHLAFNAKINDALPFLLDLFLYTSQNQKQYGKKKKKTKYFFVISLLLYT